MKYEELIDQIKTEGRIKADDEFDETIRSILNELFKDATQNQRPFELKADPLLINITASTGVSPLPADFFQYHEVFFVDVDTERTWKLVDQDEAVPPAPRDMYGHPKSFEIVGNTVLVKPKTSLVSGDQIRLVYYIIPPIITEDNMTDDNPIPRLEPFLIRSAIRRIRMFHSDDIQIAQMFQGDISTAVKGYASDTPQKEEQE